MDMAVTLGSIGTDTAQQRLGQNRLSVARNGRMVGELFRTEAWIHATIDAAKRGGQVATLALRSAMQQQHLDFKEAVSAFDAISLTAPQYFILSGPSTGVVLTFDRAGQVRTPVYWMPDDQWFFVQTNHDIGSTDGLQISMDRQTATKKALQRMGRPRGGDSDQLFAVLARQGVRNEYTVFTWTSADKKQPEIGTWASHCSLPKSGANHAAFRPVSLMFLASLPGLVLWH